MITMNTLYVSYRSDLNELRGTDSRCEKDTGDEGGTRLLRVGTGCLPVQPGDQLRTACRRSTGTEEEGHQGLQHQASGAEDP